MLGFVQQQLRDYIVAQQDLLPYVTASLNSVQYVDPAPDASKNIIFPRLSFISHCKVQIKLNHETELCVISRTPTHPLG